MTERVSQEAVEAAEAVAADSTSPNFIGTANRTRAIRAYLQAALPALEADLRERLAQEFEKRADEWGTETQIENGIATGYREAAALCRGRCENCGGAGSYVAADAPQDEERTYREECPDCNGTGTKPAAFPPSPKEGR